MKVAAPRALCTSHLASLALAVACSAPRTIELEAAPVLPDKDGWIVSVGDRIPKLELVDATGTVRSLDEFLGKPLVLLFWGST